MNEEATYRLQHRALSGRLVTADYQLRELHDTTETLTAQLINNVQDLALLVGLKSLQALRGDAIRIDWVLCPGRLEAAVAAHHGGNASSWNAAWLSD